ncbi:MAG: glycoside hydrolase family 127 protein [Kiritimatiellae bacterium]|nr:glycoside hydrolase family 127 protein [Kiritimatiellia bacterium]
MKNMINLAAVALACAAAHASCGSLHGIGNVRLKGPLGERLDAMIERQVAAADVDYITAPFLSKNERRRRWQTEFWGKWMHSAAPYALYSGSDRLRGAIEHGLDRILSSQEPSGYIGNYPDELRCGSGWDVWGMKYTMMGLMHYYDAASAQGRAADAKRALDACGRLCDYVIAEIGPNGRRGVALWKTGHWSGYASSSILEPVVWLYNRTGEKRYIDFAGYVVRGMSEPEDGPRLVDLALKGVSVADRNGYGRKPGEEKSGYVMTYSRRKAYEMMSCYQGLLEFADATDNAELRKAAAMAAEDIARTEVDLAGGCSSAEIWYHGAKNQHLPYRHLHETCVTTTWMRLCEKMLEVTGDPKWADELERTFYNAYLGALRADGSEFASYTPLSGCRWHGMDHCNMHVDCCTANGPRGFLCFLKKMFVAQGDAAVFNFYASSVVSAALADGRKVAFDVYTRYPRLDRVCITSRTEGAGAVPLKLRIPAWSERTKVVVNGEEQPGVKAGGYFVVEREWRPGDAVEIAFDMPVVAHLLAQHVAFTRGPVLLARDSRFADGDTAEPLQPVFKDGERMATFAESQVPSDGFWMTFSASLPLGWHHSNPEGRLPVTVFFCDYASAGGEWRRGNHYRTWFPLELHPPH